MRYLLNEHDAKTSDKWSISVRDIWCWRRCYMAVWMAVTFQVKKLLKYLAKCGIDVDVNDRRLI